MGEQEQRIQELENEVELLKKALFDCIQVNTAATLLICDLTNLKKQGLADLSELSHPSGELDHENS